MKKIIAIAVAAAATLGLSACSSDADTASYNLSRAAEQFEVQRRIVALNDITGEFTFELEGKCSWERDESFFQATCKHGPDDIRRHDFVLGDNTTIFSEQLEGVDVDVYSTRIILKPTSIVPTIELKTQLNDDE